MKNFTQNKTNEVAQPAASRKALKQAWKIGMIFSFMVAVLTGMSLDAVAQHAAVSMTKKTCTMQRDSRQVSVAVQGQMPSAARVSATSVSRTLPNGKQVMGAYDITITNGASEWQPQAGQPVMVSITDPNFTDGVPMDVYHESANGKDFVATVASNNHTITFPAQSFSVYIVSGTDGTKRVKVIYKNGDTEIASYYVKPDDVDDPNYTMFNRIVYDPGAGTLSQYEVFRGWTTNPSYTVNDVSSAMTIDEVREDLRTNHLTGTIAENAEVTYYAMIYKAFAISYVDENEVVLATESKLLPRTDDELSYVVNMDYTPASDQQSLIGWNVAEGANNIKINGTAYDGTSLIENNTTITLSGDVKFSVNVADGHWLVFHENGSGATYIAPQFVLTGENPTAPTLEMTRLGYTFGGWYKDEACTDNNEFDFNQPITDRTHIYAKWTVKPTANYSIIIWKQNLAGTGYDYEDIVLASGPSNTTADAVELHGTGNNAYATISGTDYQYTGFHLGSYDQNVTIKPEGGSVVNVYYDRTEYTLTFNAEGYAYTPTTSTSQNPTQYGLVDGEYVELERHGWYGNYYWTYGWYETSYEGVRYIREYYSGTVKTITALYGQPLSDYFPIVGDNGTSYAGYVWEPQNSSIYTSGDVPAIESMREENTTFEAKRYGTGTTIHMYYYTESLTESGDVQYGGVYYDEHQHVQISSDGGITSTEGEDFYDIVGYDHNGSDPAYENGRVSLNYNNDYTIKFYYTRQKFTINYMDALYVNGNGATLEDVTPIGQLATRSNITYGADLAQYANVTPTTTHDGFVFEGWYIDQRCQTPFNFAESQMPANNLTVYAKWRQIQYRVFLHPNAGTDASLDWGSDNQAMNFRISYGGKVSAPEGRRTGFDFGGWYLNEACTNLFNAADYVLNENTVTTAYNKNTDYTDPMDKWGNLGANPSNSDLTGNNGSDRFWITKRFDLYAKWRRVISDANGIQVIYDPGTGTNAPSDANYYLDNTEAIAGAASTHPDSTFSHWEVMTWDETNEKYVKSGVQVYPGGDYFVYLANARRTVEDELVVYKVTLKASYDTKQSSTPTFIIWYKNDGSTDVIRQDGTIGTTPGDSPHETLQINEAVDIPAAPIREGFVFKGWYKYKYSGDIGTQPTQVSECDPNFLDYADGVYTAHGTTNTATQVAADEDEPYDYLYAIWQPEEIIFNTLPSEVCVGTSVTLPTTSDNGIKGTWDPSTVNTTTAGTTTYTFTPRSTECAGTLTFTKDITVKAIPDATISGETTICEGNTTTLSVTAVDGYTYEWSTGELTNSITVSAADDYSVTVDNGTCSNDNSVTVTVNGKPVVESINVPTALCPGQGSYTVSATVTGGTTPYTYAWTGATASTSNPASATVTEVTPLDCNKEYNVSLIVTDKNGCASASKEGSFTVSDDQVPTIGTDDLDRTMTSTNCTYVVPDLTEEVRAISSDNCTANADLTITQSPAANTSLTTGTTQTVTVTVTDKCGKSATKEITLTIPAQPTVAVSINNETICAGGSVTLQPTATVTPSGLPTSWTWYEGTTLLSSNQNYTANPSATTTYTVKATVTENGCEVIGTKDVTVTVNDVATAEVKGKNKFCANETSTLTVTETTGATYQWYKNGTALAGETGSSLSLSGLAAGTTYTYKVTVTATSGCISEGTMTVTVYAVPTLTLTKVDQTCTEKGSITATATNGEPNYTYTLGTASSTQSGAYTFTGLEANFSTSPASAKTYTVKVVDANGCSATQTANITLNTDAITLTPQTIEVCSGTPFSNSPSDNDDIKYTWDAPDVSAGVTGGSAPTEPQGSVHGTLYYSGTGTGNATYTVTPILGVCTLNTVSVTVAVKATVRPAVQLNVSELSACAGEEITVPVTLANTANNSTLTWTFMTQTFTDNVSASTTSLSHKFTLPDDCSGSKTLTLEYHDGSTDNCDASTSVELSTSPGTWNAPAPASSNVACAADATLPTLEPVTDGCGNTIEPTYSVTSNPASITCTGTVVYTFTYKDCAGTEKTTTYTYNVTGPADPTIALAEGTEESYNLGCNPETIPTFTKANFVVTDGCNANAEATVQAGQVTSSNCDRTQIWTATYTNACEKKATKIITVTWKVTEKPTLSTDLASPITKECNWDMTTGAPAATNFTVTPGDCATSATATVSPADVVTTDCGRSRVWTATYKNTCQQEATPIQITVNWPYDETKPTIGDIAEQDALAALNCKYTIPDLEAVTLAAADDGCSTPTFVSQSIVAGTSYDQTTDEQKIDVTVKVKDACGNTAEKVVKVIIPAKLSVEATATPAIICEGSSSTLKATPTNAVGTVEYTWTPIATLTSTNAAEVTATPTETTEYTVTAQDGNGCSATKTVTVNVDKKVTLTINPAEQTICFPGAITPITVTKSAGATVSLTGQPAGVSINSDGDQISGTPTTSGTYNLTVTAEIAGSTCPAVTASAKIVVPEELKATAVAHNASCDNDDGSAVVTVTGGTAPYSYSYAYKNTSHTGVDLSGKTDNNPTGLDTAKYVVTVKDAKNCTTTAEFVVGVTSNFEVSVSSDPVVVCSGGSFSITPIVTPSTVTGTTYTWDAPAQNPAGSVTGTSAQTSPSADIHGNNLVNTTNQVATLTYTVQPANGICTATPIQVQVEVSVSFYPQVQITASNYEVCPNVGTKELKAKFANVNSSENTITWKFNNGDAVTHANAVSSTDTTDTYTVTVPSDDCDAVYTYTVSYVDPIGCTNSASGTVTVVLDDAISIENGDNNTKTVECVADVVLPHEITPSIMPTVTDACGTVLNYKSYTTPATVECEGTMAYVYTYENCNNKTTTWTYTYTIDRTTAPHQEGGPVATSKTVECLSQATEPTAAMLPKVVDACGNTLTAPEPTFGNDYNTTNCSGSKYFVYKYKDCANLEYIWTFTYNIVPTTPPTVNATGIENSKTVNCVADATKPTTVPKAISICGDELEGVFVEGTHVDNPNPLTCEGTRTYTFTYTDCAGHTATWDYVYTIESKDFTMPANAGSTVKCIALATEPAHPTDVNDYCNAALTVTGPTEGGTYNGCEGTKTYTWNYKDCSGKFSHDWVYTYTIEREDFTMPANGTGTATCLADAKAPHTLTPSLLPTVTDDCGNTLAPVEPLPTTYEIPTTNGYDGCSGDVTYTYTYKDCEGNTHDWVYTYTISAPAEPALTGIWPSDQSGINACYAGRPDFPANTTIQGLYTASCDKTIQEVTYEDKNITSDDCGWSITREYTITDGCSTVKKSITYSGSDQTNPEIATGYDTEVPANVSNCVYTYPDFREVIRPYATDNCTDQSELAITQDPVQNTTVAALATAQTLPVTITVKDNCGKTATTTINVTVPATMEMNITDAGSQCYNQADGFIKFNIAGGTPNYTATLAGPTEASATYTAAGPQSFGTLADGAYTLTVKDANGCEATDNVTIQQIANTLIIKANSNSWTYDGNAHSDDGFTVTFGDETHNGTSGNPVTLNNGDVISNVTISGSITNVSESPVANVVGTGYAITRNTTDDVTCFYNTSLVNGELRITSNTGLTLNCESQEKTFDGTALTYTAQPSVTEGTTVSYSIDNGVNWSNTAPQIINVSESPVTVKVKAENSNYATANCEYTLTINPKALTIKVTDEKTYDGTVLVSGLTKATAEGLVAGDALTAGEVTTNAAAVNSYTYSTTAAITEDFATTKGIGNYTVSYITSQTINKRDLTLTSKDLTKEYDGTALVNGTEPLATETGWVSGEGATYTFTGSQLDKGSSANSFDITPNTGTDMNNYNLIKTEGTLTVTVNSTVIVLKANSNSKVYDGTALVDPGYSYNTSLLAASDTIIATVVGTQTPVGTSDNTIHEYHVYRGMKSRAAKAIVDVTDNYTISTQKGTLEVTKRPVTITAPTVNYTYDGQVHSSTTPSITGLVGSDDISVVINSTIQYPSQSPVTNHIESYSFTTGDPDNYQVQTVDGQLTMACTKVTLAITADSKDWKYDGQEHSLNSFQLVIDGGTPINVTGNTYTFPTGDVLTVSITGSITHVSQNNVNNVIAVASILNGTENMSDCYTVTTTNGVLTISCRNITMTSGTASKTFDNTPLTAETVEVTGDGFVTGEGASYSDFASITNVSESPADNTFDYTFNTGTTESTDYCVAVTKGTLTILPLNTVEVVITERSAEYDYDGTAKTVTGYDVTSISSPLYTTADFSFIGSDAHQTVTETEVGSYPMGIVPTDFHNDNTNFTDVTFTIVDGELNIYPALVIPSNIDDYVVDITCYGDGDGKLTLPITGGKPVTPYNYSYNVTGPVNYSGNTNTPLELTNLKPGSYSLTITDALSYTVTGTFTVDEPDPLVAVITVPTATCPNQATYPVSVAVTGGRTPYNYTWSDDATNVNAASTTVPMAGTNDCGTTYTATVYVEDLKACNVTETKTFTVSDVEKPTFDAPAALAICRATDGTYDVTPTVTGEPTNLSDNCTAVADLTVSHTDVSMLPASDLATRVITREWTVTDLCGNYTTKTQLITVNPQVIMNTPENQAICHNTAMTAVAFSTTITDGTMTYNWTSDNTNIGNLPASGTGDISALTLTNTTTQAQTANIEVTPSYTNNGITCTGAPVTFTITVNPEVVMNTPADQTVCDGDNITAVAFTTTLTDGTMSYEWTRDNTTNVTTMANSGTGDIAAQAINNTTAEAQATVVTVTPTYTNNGISCTGDPITFTINVKPSATGMNNLTAYIKCNGDAFTATPTGTKIPAGTQYTWTVTPNTNVTGYSDQTTPVDAPISQALTNTSTTLQTVVYNVTAVTDGCNGETFTISVDVEPTPVLTLNCPADVNKQLNFGECEAEVTPTELGEPTWTHSLGWTVITITNDAPADNMYPEGDNIVTWTMEDECGNKATCQQHVIVTFPPCPDAVDKDGNVYHSVHIDCDCWTVRNLESLTYPDYATNHTTAHPNAGAAIPGVYNYTSSEYPNTNENVTNFGRLYDWPSVVNGGQLNDYGHVQGICPDGWYLPTAEKYVALDAHGADALKDSRFWLDGGGSNTTGFTSLPGGYYDGSILRYLNLMGEAYYWSTTIEGGVASPAAFATTYNCDNVITASTREGLGYSVRCIKERE